tara:strand:- start:406 stop:831 length:426 start_codon:yes stop_codon:yes gene_type:complete
MKTFKIFQIHLTDAEVDMVNETGDHFSVPKQAAKVRLQFASGYDTRLGSRNADDLVNDAFTNGYFRHVGNIRANDLEGVFEVGNIGPEENIERFSQMHSISVGDVILDEDGKMWLTASVGFEEVRKMVPDMFFFEDELVGA